MWIDKTSGVPPKQQALVFEGRNAPQTEGSAVPEYLDPAFLVARISLWPLLRIIITEPIILTVIELVVIKYH